MGYSLHEFSTPEAPHMLAELLGAAEYQRRFAPRHACTAVNVVAGHQITPLGNLKRPGVLGWEHWEGLRYPRGSCDLCQAAPGESLVVRPPRRRIARLPGHLGA